jgi:hypothetical protein
MDTAKSKPLIALALAAGIAAIFSLSSVAADFASARGWCHKGFPLAGINAHHLRKGACAHRTGYSENR